MTAGQLPALYAGLVFCGALGFAGGWFAAVAWYRENERGGWDD